jgi:hypothetical protein
MGYEECFEDLFIAFSELLILSTKEMDNMVKRYTQYPSFLKQHLGV